MRPKRAEGALILLNSSIGAAVFSPGPAATATSAWAGVTNIERSAAKGLSAATGGSSERASLVLAGVVSATVRTPLAPLRKESRNVIVVGSKLMLRMATKGRVSSSTGPNRKELP